MYENKYRTKICDFIVLVHLYDVCVCVLALVSLQLQQQAAEQEAQAEWEKRMEEEKREKWEAVRKTHWTEKKRLIPSTFIWEWEGNFRHCYPLFLFLD